VSKLTYFENATCLLCDEYVECPEAAAAAVREGVVKASNFILPDRAGWNGTMATIRRDWMSRFDSEYRRLSDGEQ
jgi:hypothetical protein